jgi:O-antigen/teichoic acid export membrane protein
MFYFLNLKPYISRLVKHELITGSFYLFLGGMVGNFFAFLLNLFLARNLSYADYGIFASLLAIVSLAYIPGQSINTIIVKFATRFFAEEQMDKFAAFYQISFKILFVIALTFFLILVALAYPISSFLKLDNLYYGLVIAAIVGVHYLGIINHAFLQSLLKFFTLSSINVFSSFIKLIAGVLFVYLGFAAFSGLLAILFMTIGAFIIAFIPLRMYVNKTSNIKVSFPNNEIMSYSIPAFFTVFFLTSFTSSDVILVRHFFDAKQAGFYAGLSLIGKVIFYFTAPIPSVLFPLLVKRHALGATYKRLFYLALFLVFVPSLGLSLFYIMFPHFVINLFLGGREYLEIANLLGIFGLYIMLVSLISVCVNFFLSFNQTRVWLLVIPFSVLQIILISIFHNSFYQVIYLSIMVSFGLLISLLLYYFKKFGL